MGRNLYHSAEGSHWTKKNHKYIRKEGNRYIYPEDVAKSSKTKTARDILSEKGVRRVEYKTLEVPSNRNGFDNSHDRITFRDTDYKDKNGNYRSSFYTNNDKRHDGSFYKPTNSLANPRYKYRDEIEANEKKARQAENRKNSLNKQGTRDYKKFSEQHANRQAAKSGKVVNPTYTLRDNQGNKVARLQSKDKVQMPTVADYKKASQLTSGAKNRKKMVDSQGSLSSIEKAKAQAAAQKRKNTLNSQGSNPITTDRLKKVNQERRRKEAAGASNLYVRNQDDAKRISKLRKETSDWILQDGKDVAFTHEDVRPGKNGGRPKVFKTYELRSGYSADAANRQKNAQRKAEANIKSYDYAKEQDNWNQSNPGTTRAKKKLATYRQGNSLFADDSPYTKKHVTKEMAQRTDEFDKDLNRRKYANSVKESNKEIIKNASNKLKKKGYFTVQNGKTVFVPSDDITMKKVSKGRQLVDKIKSKFSKKK